MYSPLALVRDVSSVESGNAVDVRTQASLDVLEQVVGVNLARLRAERQLSLDALARLSGVSRAMLAQIESARSVPSIKVLCKIAAALKVSVAAFLRRHAVNGFEHLAAERASRVVSSNGRFSARALYPEGEPAAAEFHELRIAPLHTEPGARRAPGTTVNLVVSEGTLEVSVHERRPAVQPAQSGRQRGACVSRDGEPGGAAALVRAGCGARGGLGAAAPGRPRLAGRASPFGRCR